jgi:predicted Ser/Thr protein kinase
MHDQILGRLLGSGKEAEAFEYGPLVAKLYRAHAPKRSAFREAAILALVEQLGLPAPRVWGVRQIEDRWGVLMDLASGPSFAEAVASDASLTPDYLRAMALLHLRIRQVQCGVLYDVTRNPRTIINCYELQ